MGERLFDHRAGALADYDCAEMRSPTAATHVRLVRRTVTWGEVKCRYVRLST
ncbi:MAG: hypothetical protein ACR2F6_19235 [Mycobacteriales bacterium]